MERMGKRTVTSCNYITSVNGMVHPDRVMEDHDFLYILEGEWEVWEDGISYFVKADDLLILKAGSHHYGTVPCNPGNRHMYFHVEPLAMDHQKEDGKMQILEIPTLIHCAGAPQIRRYFHDLISVFWSEGERREDQLSLLCNLIMNALCEMSASPAEGIAGDALVEKVCQKIRTSPQKIFTATAMADEFFICPRTLNNRFKKIYGQSFCAYQMELRLRMVQQYLRYQPDATLYEAAVNYGFCDEFHLSHAFKKQFGISPSSYRKTLR